MAKIRRSRTQWQALIDRQPDSGLTIANYCAEHNITVSGFYQWRKKLCGNPEVQSAPSDWLSVSHSPSSSEEKWQIELSLPGGVTLRMSS
jgi:putative transposase